MNQLHINMEKSVHMHFRPNFNASERLTCARTREFNSENTLKLGSQKLKKVDRVKFLGVIIDENLNWEFIWIHNKIMTCSGCKVIVHAKCAKSIFKFNNVVNSWHCYQCLEQPPKYNPFAELSHDKHAPNSLEDIE